MDLKKHLKAPGRRRVLEGANLFLYTVIGIAIIVAVNWYASNHDKRWDLTPNKNYSLSLQSKKLLKTLDRNVTIYVFDRKQQFQERRDLLDEYEAASHDLKVDYVDPLREPGLARQFDVHNYGTIIVAAASRHFKAESDTEQGVTNALIRVLQGQKSVCFIEGHGERDLQGSDPSGYEQIDKELDNENYQVKSLTLLQKNEIPSDCTAVVIAGPKYDYTPVETETIKKYVDGGGRALFMLDAGRKYPNLAKLLSGWGVTLNSDLVIDLNPVAQLFGTTPDMPLIMKYGTNPIVEPLKRTATLFPITRSLTIEKATPSGVSDDSLAESSANSFGVAGFNPQMRQVSYRPGKDVKGPLTVAVAGSVPANGKKGSEGRFVVLGTSAVAANGYLGFQGNRDFVMNSVDWLSAEENLISIRPKSPEEQHLDLSSEQMGRILYLGVFGLPLLIIVLGGVVWWRRR
jgi:gliding motility-associatede transport system auxiliary component